MTDTMTDHGHDQQVADYGECITCAARLPAPTIKPPVVRDDDPWSSHLAAERIEPHRGTRKAAVLAALRGWPGWVNGDRLTTEAVGGSEGLRRIRELRADGWNIDRRPNPTGVTGWQYRLSPDSEQPVEER